MTNQSTENEGPALSPAALRDFEQRPLRLWHVDGLAELTMGVLWVLWGGAMIGEDALPKEIADWWRKTVPPFLVVTGLAASWVIRKLKRRIVAPRAGFVEMKPPTRATRVTAAVIAAATAVLLAWMIGPGKALGWERLFCAGLAIVLALGYVITSLRMRLPHLMLLAAWTAAGGLVVAPFRPGLPGMQWLFVWIGTGSVLLGAVRLKRFMRMSPPAAERP